MYRTYQILLILTIILSARLPVQAQHILKGVVYDEVGTGVFSTTLHVLTEDSAFVSGGITDDNGNFEIKNIKAGKYILAVSNIGYAGQYIAFEMPESDYTLPTIVLKTDVVALGEVTVKGSSFIRKKDYLLIIPDKQQIKHAFSGYDLLYNLMIPGLDVNHKEKKVTATTGEATLYINGVKADFRDVQNLRPRDIEKVEYYSMPTGKYMGDAASINYITKTYTTGGYVNMEAEQKLGYFGGNYDAAAKLSHKQTDYSFYGGYSATGYGGIKKEKNETLFLSDYTLNRKRETEYADYKNNQQYVQFQVNNNHKRRNLLGRISLNHSVTPHNDRDERLNYTGHDVRSVMSSESSKSSSLIPTAYLRGDFNLSEKHLLKSELVTWYTRNTYERTYMEDKRRSSTSVNENMYSFAMTNRYTFRPDTSNTYLIHLNHYQDRSSMEYSGDYVSNQHLLNGQTIFRINYIREFWKKATLYVDPGISLMNYRLQNERMKYVWTFRTNTWLRYRFNSLHWIGVGFSHHNNQPEISTLNEVDQTIDFYQIKRGNPNLKNTKMLNLYMIYEGRIGPFNMQARVWKEQFKHNIYSHYYTEGNKLISSYRSDGSFNRFNADMSVSCRISDHIRAHLGLEYHDMYTDIEQLHLSQKNIAVSADVNYFIKSFAINTYLKIPKKILDQSRLVFMETPMTYGLSVRYSNRNLLVEAGTENPFTKQAQYKEYADYNIYQYNQTQTSRIYQQTAYLKLAYTFDFGRKTSHEQSEVDKTIKSAILKAE